MIWAFLSYLYKNENHLCYKSFKCSKVYCFTSSTRPVYGPCLDRRTWKKKILYSFVTLIGHMALFKLQVFFLPNAFHKCRWIIHEFSRRFILIQMRIRIISHQFVCVLFRLTMNWLYFILIVYLPIQRIKVVVGFARVNFNITKGMLECNIVIVETWLLF